MFTTGQLIFALFFFVAFALVVFFSYRKDKKLHARHYTGSIKILIGFILFLIILLLLKGWIKS
ncbi:hypothetical protein [Sinomicrobium weinanense]|uniref:Uncharacterized protein n=1 Tax=Sinomicrobium weinanense TaxID=2842200 RepID=A0A926Q2V2_9FLAO|nr:hypothetical protein [Sinomicrobium weinanense]MBC9796209.1 hypothetical protein [Sinomicrobium weinanense]MBU3123488.1 hypothetical protein [Sinomicrobium weinanense]